MCSLGTLLSRALEMEECPTGGETPDLIAVLMSWGKPSVPMRVMMDARITAWGNSERRQWNCDPGILHSLLLITVKPLLNFLPFSYSCKIPSEC